MEGATGRTPGGGIGGAQGSGPAGTGSGGDPEGALRESMEGYDREIARERGAMASAGQGSAAGSGGAGGMIGQPGGSGGAMVTIPNASGGGIGGDGQGSGSASAGSSAGDSSAGGGGGSGGGQGTGGPAEEGASGERPETKVEIPEDIAEVTGKEDQVARQIREAAEQEEDQRIREALWDEYRKHMGLKSK